MSDCFLPEEVVEEILSRVSSKSLIRFKCVCKRWSFLVSCPQFLSKHFLPSCNNEYEKKKLLVRRRMNNTSTYQHHLCSLSDPSKTLPLPIPLSVPPGFITSPNRHGYDIEILGICNGLMCLISEIGSLSRQEILLWNVRDDDMMMKVVPKPDFPNPPGTVGGQADFGFGYDALTGDYKLVKITSLWDDDTWGVASGRARTLSHKVEIYSLESDTWQGSIHEFPPIIIYPSRPPPYTCITHFAPHIESLAPVHAHSAYVNGVVYWTCSHNRLMWFQITDESFGFTSYPSKTEIDNAVIGGKSRDAPVQDTYWRHNLFVLNDTKIALVVNEDEDPPDKYFYIWVLLDVDVQDSWIRWLTLGPFEVIERPLWFFNNDQIVMETFDRELVLFNPFTRQTESLNISGIPRTLQIISIQEKLNFSIS